MKKILFLITQAEMGGAQKYVLELASALKKEGFKTAVASEKNDFFEEKLLENDVKFYELKYIKRSINPISDFLAFFEIYKLIKSKKPDIVHLNSSKIGVLGSFAGKLAGVKKVVFTAHGWVFNELLPFWKKAFYIFASQLAALFEDKIICVSSYDKYTSLKYKIKNEKDIVVINNGIDKEKIHFLSKQKAREKLNLPQKKIIIGTVANLYENKGIKHLIESAGELLKQKDDIIFVVLGDGPEKENLKKQIKKLNIEKEFLLLGAKKDAFLYMKAFDIFVLPSQKEGFPYTLLEAGLAKLPVITTNVGGIPDLINETNAVSVMSRDPKQLKEAILNLLNKKDIQKIISENLYKDVSEKFTLKNMVQKTKEVYS